MSNLKVITWNLRRATFKSPAWEIITRHDPNIIILQEVNSIPQLILNQFSVYKKLCITKTYKNQVFFSAILVKGQIQSFQMKSDYDWVNNELQLFAGNLLSCEIQLEGNPLLKVISVYSPAWPIPKERYKNFDWTQIKLKNNPELWGTELLWAALLTENKIKDENWIIAGDFNSSVTFDHLWQGGPRGNQEIIERMNSLGLHECLASHQEKLTPTFRNPRGGKILHQIDHMYASENIFSKIISSIVGDEKEIFGKSISDHLPIITEFNMGAK